MKKTKNALPVNQMTPGIQVNGGYGIGGSQPPMNRIVVIAHMVAIATYSPSMNIMYGVEPYSTMKPATSSDSASTRSNGGRLVSASAEMKNTTNIGNSGSPQVTSGASRNTPLLAAAGMVGSFRTNFKRSAKDCSKPHGPTTFGPRRICTAAQIFRSASRI